MNNYKILSCDTFFILAINSLLSLKMNNSTVHIFFYKLNCLILMTKVTKGVGGKSFILSHAVEAVAWLLGCFMRLQISLFFPHKIVNGQFVLLSIVLRNILSSWCITVLWQLCIMKLYSRKVGTNTLCGGHHLF